MKILDYIIYEMHIMIVHTQLAKIFKDAKFLLMSVV